ncbi:MAG: hypothetical protein Q8916_10335, partial [Bacteroidota bacterium]|nr:hypothetical protein [Bacteroidota bacterium]
MPTNAEPHTENRRYLSMKKAAQTKACAQRSLSDSLRIIGPVFLAVMHLAAADLLAQWTLVAPNVILPIARPYIGGGILISHNGILWAGYRDVWMSSDLGKSWSMRTPFNGFNNSCIKDISFFDDNIGLVTTQNGEIYITQDQGLSWVQHRPMNPYRPYPSIEGACFVGTPNNIIACSYAGDRYMTIDGGMTWTITLADSLAYQVHAGKAGTAYLSGGFERPPTVGAHIYETNDYGVTWFAHPGTFNPDSYSFTQDRCDTSTFYVVNDDLSARTDKSSRIFISSDNGTTWVPNDQQALPYHCGSITSGSGTLYVQTFTGVRRSTDQGKTWKDIGGPPNITDTRFVAAIDDNIIAAVDSFGTVWVTYN